MACISKGELNTHARREIIQSVTHKMLNYCKYPSKKQREVVASRIVETINGSRDALGISYVSFLLNVAKYDKVLKAANIACIL